MSDLQRVPDPAIENWWTTLPGLLTAAAGFITATVTLIGALNNYHIWPFNRLSSGSNGSPTTAIMSNDTSDSSKLMEDTVGTLKCSGEHDSWGKKPCGDSIIIFQPVYSGNDSAIITSNVGSRPIRVEIMPLCDRAPQCGSKWKHIVYPVPNADDGSKNQNLTINEPGVHEFTWVARDL